MPPEASQPENGGSIMELFLEALMILSLCIAVAMVMGINSQFPFDNEQDNTTLCIMDVEEELF